MNTYIVLVRDDESFSEWWKKGEYEAASAGSALEQAWAGTFHTPRRNGLTTHRYRCAVVAPDVGWIEYTVTLEAQPSIVTVAAGSSQTRGDEQ